MPYGLSTKLSSVKQKSATVRGEVRERVLGYITAAFGLVAGLAWNDAVKALIDYILPEKGNGVLAKFFYATFISLVVVVITIVLIRLSKRNEAIANESAPNA